MNPSGGSANESSGTPPTVTINVNQADGTLTINGGTTTMNTDRNNPTSDWSKTTYTPKSGTFDITVEGKKAAEGGDSADHEADPTKGLNTAISSEKTGVDELYHYKKNANEEVLKLKKANKYYIYYYTTGNSWTKQSSESVNDAVEDVKTVIEDEPSNRVEIQLEKKNNQNYGLTSVTGKGINVGTATVPVTGYTGYKHSRSGASNTFKIEKVRHNGTEMDVILPGRT